MADGDDAVLLCERGCVDDPGLIEGYREVLQLDDYIGSPMVEYHADRLHERHGFDAVVALSEWDVLRAARMRERWGLAGQRPESALAFRDKVEMKRRLTGAGIPMARFQPVGNVGDLLDLPQSFAYPFVVKPRREASANGVTIVPDEETLRAYLDGVATARGDYELPLLAEEYLDHELYLFDGIVSGGRPAWSWCSWMSSNLGHRSGRPLVCSTMDVDDPLRHEITELGTAALEAMPLPDHTTFHMELFGTASRGLVVNEVASRVGGARIDAMLAQAFGVGPVEAYLSGVVRPSARPLPAALPRQMASFAMARPRAGVLTGLPLTCTLPGVTRYEPLAALGARLSDPVNVVSAIASVITVGPDRSVADARLADAVEWLEKRTEIVGPAR
jgi:biotin carboxylase